MNEVSIFEAVGILWRRKLLILVIVVIAAVSAYLISETQPDIYRAETTLVFPGSPPTLQIPGLGSLMGRLPVLPGALDSTSLSTTVIMPLLKSRDLGARVVRKCGLRKVYGTGSLQGATALLKRDTSVSQDATGTVTLAVKAKDPELAARIANCYVEELDVLARSKIDLSMVARSLAFVDRQLVRVKKELEAAEERRRKFETSHQIIALPEEAGAAVRQVAELAREREMTRIELETVGARLAETRRQIEAQTSRPVEELPANSPVIQGLREKLVEMEKELLLARQEYTDESPLVQRVQADIDATRQLIRREVERIQQALQTGLAPELTPHEVDRIALEARAEAVKRALDTVQADFERLPSESLQLARLKRDEEVQAAIYTMLNSEREKLRLMQAKEGPPFVVLDEAVVPEGRVWPRPQLITILAAILGFIAAATVAFFMEYAERARYAAARRADYAPPDGVPMEEEIVERPTHARPRA